MDAIVLNRTIAQGIFNDNALREELIELLNILIDEELAKSDGEADFDLIDEYSEALNDLYSEQGTLQVLGKLQTADAFLARVSDNKKWKNLNRTLKMTLAACAVLAFIFTANMVTEKTTGVDVLGSVAQAVRNVLVGEQTELHTALPSGEDVSITGAAIEDTTAETAAEPSEAAGDTHLSVTVPQIGQAQQNNTPTGAGAQNANTVKPKNPNLSQVLSPEAPPTEKEAETTTQKPFVREDEYETAAPRVVKLTGTFADGFKRSYKVGEAADFSGLTITAQYDNGAEKQIPLSACTVHGFSTETAANRIVTIEYEGCSFSYLIRVSEV